MNQEPVNIEPQLALVQAMHGLTESRRLLAVMPGPTSTALAELDIAIAEHAKLIAATAKSITAAIVPYDVIKKPH